MFHHFLQNENECLSFISISVFQYKRASSTNNTWERERARPSTSPSVVTVELRRLARQNLKTRLMHISMHIALHSQLVTFVSCKRPLKGADMASPLLPRDLSGSGCLTRNGLVLCPQFLFRLLTFVHFAFLNSQKVGVQAGGCYQGVRRRSSSSSSFRTWCGRRPKNTTDLRMLGLDNSIIVIRLLHIHFHSFVIRSLVSYFRGAAFSCFASVWSRRDLSALKNGSMLTCESTAHAPKIRTACCFFAFATW